MTQPGDRAERAPSVGAVDLVTFGCEVAAAVLLVVSGCSLGSQAVMRVLLALLLPAVLVTVWSRWIAPKAARRLRQPARFAAQVAVIGAVAVVSGLAGHAWWGVALVLLAVPSFGVVGRRESRAAAPSAAR